MRCDGGPPFTSFAHSTLPVAAFTQTSSRLLLSGSDVCTNTFPFDTMGDELPRPGTGAFQRISLGPMLTGMLVSGAVPSPSGPRNRDQSPATRAGPARRATSKASRGVYMGGGGLGGFSTGGPREIIPEFGRRVRRNL